jgi:4-hydroxymandelate oxidase
LNTNETTEQLLTRAVTLDDFEELARDVVAHMVYEYIAGGAGDEVTLRANRASFDKLRLRPRALVDVSEIDTTVELFGETMEFPILLAPTAYHKLVHPSGELGSVEGANLAGATLIASTSSSTSIEEMAAVSTRPLWFQLYASTDRGFTGDLVRRAEAVGCRALCLTVDAPIRGIRDRDARSGFALPPGIGRPNLEKLGPAAMLGNPRPSGRGIYSPNLDPAVTWKDVEWLRGFTKLPLLLKGILSGEDAAKGLERNVHGIIVSNHGARTVDGVFSSMEALPEVITTVQGQVPVLLDGGIRRGTDILKAIALGASAVLIGRSYLYGLAVAGPVGVQRVIEVLRTELEMAMALCGRPTLAHLDRELLG